GGAVRDDHGDRLADVAHLVRGNNVLRERLHLGNGIEADGHLGQGAGIVRGKLARREHRVYARQAARGIGVYADDAPVRDLAAYDDGVQHARQMDVVDIAALAAQQPQVLDPLNRLSDEALGHRSASFPRVGRSRLVYGLDDVDVA